MGAEYFIVDAGWYPGCPPGNFDAGVGNLACVDTTKFPRGLQPLADLVRSQGMKFGLWFELERAHRESRWAQEHPEWFWDVGQPFLHLNLTRQDAQDAAIQIMVEAVRKLGIEWIKLDYNTGPLPYWESVDSTGKVQFSYCQGIYRVLDETLRQCPELLMECCASGGRRMDLGILRRAHTSWISDECNAAENTRYMQAGSNLLLPGQIANSGIPFGREEGGLTFTDYEVLSRMLGSFEIAGDITLLPPERRQRMRNLVDSYKRFRHLLPLDFYPLLPQPHTAQEWEAVQFVQPDGSECVVLAFSGTEPAAHGTPVLRLHGLTPGAQYQLAPLHSSARQAPRSGAELLQSGLTEPLPASGWCGWLIRRTQGAT